MNQVGEAASRPSDILPALINVIGEGIQNGQTFDHLDIRDKGHLALLGYFSSAPENAGDPGPYWRHHAQRGHDRMSDILVANMDESMRDAPSYQEAREAGTLGLTMAAVYTGIRAVRHHGVHVEKPVERKGRVVDGVATAAVTRYAVNDATTGTMLEEYFEGVHNKFPTRHYVKVVRASEDWQAPDNPWDGAWIPSRQTYLAEGTLVENTTTPAPTPEIVEVTNLDEYARILTHGKGALIRKELKKIGVLLPHEKEPLETWLQTHTLPPEIEEWLRAIDDTYNTMHESGFVQADYIDDPDEQLQPGRRAHIIATDDAAASKAERDGLNGLIHTLKNRGNDSRHNQEQNPRRRDRYAVEKRVSFKRPKAPKPDETYTGPPIARPLNVWERALIEIHETWLEVRENPKGRLGKALPEVLGDVVGKAWGGIADLAVSGSVLVVKGLVGIWKGTRNHVSDYRGWRGQKKQARSRLATILGELKTMETAIAEARLADLFPDTSMAPSPQLDLIKSMTSMMLANLPEGPAHE